MNSNLPNSFFGNKKYVLSCHQKFISTKNITDEEVRKIFQPSSSTMSWAKTSEEHDTQGCVFAEFIRANLLKFSHWQFEKLSAWIELSAHVFTHSFENHLNNKQSFQYFSQVLVRHSLFRPPHCVDVFKYEDSKQIMEYWLQTFVRFYEEYRECFESELNEIVYAVAPQTAPDEAHMQLRKQISRQDFNNKFSSAFQQVEENKKGQ